MSNDGSVTCTLRMPNQSKLYDQVIANAPYVMARQNSHVGKSVAICGAGPSLKDAPILITEQAVGDLYYHGTDELWACNSALPYLMGRGQKVTHGFCIDQGEEMLRPHEWATTYDVNYLIASSVHPDLVKHLRANGRSITMFHNFLGVPQPEDWVDPTGNGQSYEHFLYTRLYPTSVVVGHGLNAVPRAVCLALVMGFSKITVYGADCATAESGPMPAFDTEKEAYGDWLDQLVMYADGRTVGQCWGREAAIIEARGIDQRRLWHTRPDMVISAKHLVDLQRMDPKRIEFVGDVLPNILNQHDDDWLADLPQLDPSGAVTNIGNASLEPVSA